MEICIAMALILQCNNSCDISATFLCSKSNNAFDEFMAQTDKVFKTCKNCFLLKITQRLVEKMFCGQVKRKTEHLS